MSTMSVKKKFALLFILVIQNCLHSFAFIQNGAIHVEKAVEHYNKKIGATWKAYHNDMYGVTISHIKTKLGVLPESKEYEYDEHHDLEDDSQLPEHFDSRVAFPGCTSISSIVDQSNCESCWAISIAAALSDRFCIQSKGVVNVTLSSAKLLSCSKTNDGCGGGVMVEAWNYVKAHGLVTGGGYGSFEGCQPYLIRLKGSIGHRYNIPQSTTPKCHHNKCWNRKYPKKEGETYKSVFQTNENEELIGLHAVRLIGWGVENGVKYWIAANSWGENWGENGFLRIERGTNHCQIESMVHAGQPKIEIPKRSLNF